MQKGSMFRISTMDPRDANALHLLGVICIHQGRNPDALELIGTALKDIREPFSSLFELCSRSSQPQGIRGGASPLPKGARACA